MFHYTYTSAKEVMFLVALVFLVVSRITQKVTNGLCSLNDANYNKGEEELRKNYTQNNH